MLGGVEAVRDYIDGRPERRILFIGNSRTFYNDMPGMVRKIADSALHSERLHIEMDAQPGVSLADHLERPDTQSLIANRWDNVVLQVLSSEQYSARQSGAVWEAATRLISDVKRAKALPAMFVTWRYTDDCDQGAGLPQPAVGLPISGYADMHANIQKQHMRLAQTTGVDLVNVGLLWEQLQYQDLDFSLYSDCNHPSAYGSYLSALMFYGYFTGGRMSDVTYAPDEIGPTDAALLRSKVSLFLGQAS